MERKQLNKELELISRKKNENKRLQNLGTRDDSNVHHNHQRKCENRNM